MHSYITGTTIRNLREKRGLTQAKLGELVGVGSKAVSKWETGKGLPDISLIDPLAKALGVSVIELLSGDDIHNANRSCNILRSKLYVCPVCGNIIHAAGDTVISCCGITLPPLEAEEPDGDHTVQIQRIEDEWYVTVDHPMTKDHSISFLAWVTTERFTLVKCYPEGSCEARFPILGHGMLYLYCNRHGLMKQRV